MSFKESDEEIIDLYKNGKQEVFKILIDRYTSSLFNFSVHFVGKENVSDIIQEVFIKVWKNLQKFDKEKSSFKTWIFNITKNTTTDFLRKKKNVLFSDMTNDNTDEENNSFEENIPDESLLPDEAIQKLNDKELLNDLLEQLPNHYKTILILHYQEDMTFDEIGKILNKPLNTVKSYHRRAILLLRDLLKSRSK